MSDNVRYWLWLQKAFGEGAHITKILDEFGSAEKLYNATIIDWKMSSAITSKQISKLESTSINDIENIIYTCDQNGWSIIDYDDSAYPQRLKQIYNPPAVLYVDGDLPNIDELAVIGVVGTRKPSEYALKVSQIMSRGIAEAGALVISGGALGIDSSAHRGALAAGGKTIAVLGCGLGTDYLRDNQALRAKIRNNGALVTEYSPFTKPSRTTFPMRNRIISGLSVGVLVVEASVKSGSLITANFALEQNRDVYAVPVSVLSTDFAGTNKLIDDGARVATKPQHLIEAYAAEYVTLDMSRVRSIEELMYDESDKSANVSNTDDKLSFDKLEDGRRKLEQRQEAAAKLRGAAKTVFDCLDESYMHIDMIIDNSGLTSSKVMIALTELELSGLVESASGKRYRLS